MFRLTRRASLALILVAVAGSAGVAMAENGCPSADVSANHAARLAVPSAATAPLAGPSRPIDGTAVAPPATKAADAPEATPGEESYQLAPYYLPYPGLYYLAPRFPAYPSCPGSYCPPYWLARPGTMCA